MMKKALSVIMTVCMMLGILPMTVLSENVEHVIMTAEDWAAFADDIAKGEGCADTWKLGADISVTATSPAATKSRRRRMRNILLIIWMFPRRWSSRSRPR